MATKEAVKDTKTKKPAAKSAPKVSPQAVEETSPKAPKKGDFAVIATGGKQYMVSVGDVIEIEKLADKKEGDSVTFDEVLLTNTSGAVKVGTPTVAGAKVTGKILKEDRAKKLHVIRFRSKSRHFRKIGHRQPFMKVEITKI